VLEGNFLEFYISIDLNSETVVAFTSIIFECFVAYTQFKFRNDYFNHGSSDDIVGFLKNQIKGKCLFPSSNIHFIYEIVTFLFSFICMYSSCIVSYLIMTTRVVVFLWALFSQQFIPISFYRYPRYK